MGTNKPALPSDDDPGKVAGADDAPPPAPRPARILVETEVLFLFGVVGLVVVAVSIEKLFGLDDPLSFGPVSAIVLSAAPSLLWLGYFYRQDRHEPEPKHFVFGLFLLGAFVGGPIAAFLAELSIVDSVLAPLSLKPLTASKLVSAFLVVAVAQELTKYCVVRYTMYPSREFDEPLDGFVYATAVGIGFATFENFRYLQGAGGQILFGAGIATTVVSTLAHACFAGVTGYALGRAKFISLSHLRRTVVLITGLTLAIALNGGFHIVSEVARARGFAREPWREVVFTAGFVVIVFFAISLAARRLVASSPHKATPPSAEATL